MYLTWEVINRGNISLATTTGSIPWVASSAYLLTRTDYITNHYLLESLTCLSCFSHLSNLKLGLETRLKLKEPSLRCSMPLLKLRGPSPVLSLTLSYRLLQRQHRIGTSPMSRLGAIVSSSSNPSHSLRTKGLLGIKEEMVSRPNHLPTTTPSQVDLLYHYLPIHFWSTIYWSQILTVTS